MIKSEEQILEDIFRAAEYSDSLDEFLYMLSTEATLELQTRLTTDAGKR